MSNIREIIGNGGAWEPIGFDERPVIKLDTTPWGGSPSSVSLAAYTWVESTETYTDATATIFPAGSASISGRPLQRDFLAFLRPERRHG